MIGDLDLERARRADRLFAELFDLDEAERHERLALLRTEDADVAALLDRLFAAAQCRTEASLAQALQEGASFVARARFAAEDTFIPGSSIGAWRIVQQLARGGSSRVFVAERIAGGFRQRAALKLFERSPEHDGELVQRFEQERQILATLAHPNIARVLDGGVADDGRPYLVLELIEGEPIDRWCATRNPSLAERLELLATAARAVQHAHSHLIVHRDLKPSNLLVDRSGVVKLLDFGIAKVLAGSPAFVGTELPALATRTTARPLTPAYASPEQIRGDPVQTASDVYQLGLLLYEILAGRPAHLFREDSWRELERVVCEADPPPLTPSNRRRPTADGTPTALGRIPADLETIVRKALQKDPKRRYSSADRLADDIERFLTNQPVLARPDTIRYRARKFVRRHRLAVGAALGISAAVASGGVATAWQAREAARQRDASRLAAERSERALGLLLEVFEIADEGGGAAVTARELVERSVARLRAEPRLDLLRVERLTILARAYEGLGLSAEAAELRSDLVRLARERYGSESFEAALELDRLGNTLVRAGDFQAAISLLEESLRLQVAKLGEEHPEVLSTSSHLSYALGVKGDVGRSLALRERVLDARRRLHGETHGEVAQAWNDVGRSLRFLGRTEEAERHLRQAIELRRRLDGSDAPSVGVPLANLALVLLDRGALAEAESAATEALALAERSVRPGHPSLAGRIQLLGSVCLAQRRLPEAEARLRSALALRRSALPPSHFSLAEAELALAEALFVGGRMDEADALASAADERLRQSFPERGFRVGQAAAFLGACRAASGGGPEAVRLAEEGYASVVSELGVASPIAVRARYHLESARAAASGRASSGD